MARRRRGSHNALDAWPGYVDALSTLLMVVTFVLLVFVVGQQFLSVSLTRREHTLDALQKQLAELSHMLAMTEDKNHTLNATVASLGADKQHNEAQLTALSAQLATLTGQLHDREQALTNADTNAKTQTSKISDLQTQIDELTRQLQAISNALDLEKKNSTSKDDQIKDLGNRLNIALADKVNQLKRYRSEFFGRLRDLLKDQKGVNVVGDRFVFQSEILFPQGSADLTPAGRKEITTLAHTFKQVASTIPTDLPWILRVDGHADRQPIHSAFPSNWELSSERAITVVKLLINEGVDPHHLAATGFSDYQPLDSADTTAAYARNRRIEFRLTDR
ncbi:peptidoglycan -binding protein [Neokomagataea thailandica]|uniref:Flagellar motor protein n=1 Tax=Neokomagataea tanensis NBRC 106556 TaxID=1223519 RepID=A0ABQ0QH87_9PROT|nr:MULTISPECIES: peptidoglycan -binding protein [Neokomagataea]GBR44692.1 flagellar motor protein [Neokomagataea tanensis NBRC 106556]